MSCLRTFLVSVSLALCAAAPPCTAAFDAAGTLERIHRPDLRPEASVEIRSLDIEIGPGTIHVERGALVPAEEFGGRPMEFVFLGDARFELFPPSEVEAGQLELFTGSTIMDMEIHEAILIIGSREGTRSLTSRSHGKADPETLLRARELYATWLDRPERKMKGVEAALFRAAAGDPTYSRYSAMWCRTEELGDFYYQVDPDELEQVSLGQFVPYPADDVAKRRLSRHLRSEQRKGRLRGVRFEDIGTWDVWLSSTLLDSDGEFLLGDQGVEPKKYILDVTLDPGKQELSGIADIDLFFERDDRKVLAFKLHPDLTVESVTDTTGNELFHFPSGDRFYVLLSSPTVRGERHSLEIAFRGPVLRRHASRHYSPVDTVLWYPHIGTLDRARYDVIFRWPKHLDLIASGRKIDAGESRGRRWQRRLLEAPGIAFSFELGKFLIMKEKIGTLDLTVAFSQPAVASTTRRMRTETIKTIRDSLLFYQAIFGPCPILEMSVVTVPREFSQAFLGFVTLSESSFHNAGPRDWELRRQRRDKTISHELAHQWWGNMIGWMSYRDQWLSEAMANYAALLFLDHRGGGYSSYLAALSQGWKWSLGARTKDGRTMESIGPLVLGSRLNSSKAGDAYRTIVYHKGAVVLAMLAREFTETNFLNMLNALAYAANNRVIATDHFVRALEHMSGRKLDKFADRYIYGTGIPEVYYTYRFEQDDKEGWIVEGEARQVASHRYIHRVVRTDSGGWDVRRVKEPELDIDLSRLTVPIMVELEPVTITGSQGRRMFRKRRKADREHTATMSGMLPIEGAVENFRIPVAGKPKLLQLDPRGEVLANFYSETTSPKRVLHYRGRAMAEEGDLEETERLYLAALEIDVNPGFSGDEMVGNRERERDGRNRDILIRLDLTRMYLDDGRTDDAAVQLDTVYWLLRGPERFHHRLETILLESRILIRRGRYEDAFDRLKRLRPLIQPRSSFESWQSYAMYLQFHSRRSAISEALAMYALTAKLTGRTDELDWAGTMAADRGCDLEALR